MFFDPFLSRQSFGSALQAPRPQITDYGGIGLSPGGPTAPLPTWNGNHAQLPTSSWLANLRSAPQVPNGGGLPTAADLAGRGSSVTPRPQDQPAYNGSPGLPGNWSGLNPWAQEFGAGNTMATLMGGNPYAGFFNNMAGNTTPMYYGDPNQMNQTASYGGILGHINRAQGQMAAEAKASAPNPNGGGGVGLGNVSPAAAGAGAGLLGLAMNNPYTIPLAGAAYGGKALWNKLFGGSEDPPRYKTDPNAPPGSNTRPASSGSSGAGSSSGASGPTHRN